MPTNARGESVVKLTPAPPIETVSVLVDEEDADERSSTSSSSLCTTEEESIENEAIRAQCDDCVDDIDDSSVSRLQDDWDNSEIDEAISAQSAPASSSGTQRPRSMLRAIPSPSRETPMGLAVQASSESVRSHQRMNMSVPFS